MPDSVLTDFIKKEFIKNKDRFLKIYNTRRFCGYDCEALVKGRREFFNEQLLETRQ
jgi:hypothetical protein